MATYPSWDKHAHWVRVYRARIRLGHERCRQCRCPNVWGTGSQLTLDHIHPRSRGGVSLMENATILCADCNNRKGSDRARYTISLWHEEQNAPRRERWSRFPVPEVPHGPWDEPGSCMPPRSVKGKRRAIAAQLPPWARALYLDYEDELVPEWVASLIRSRYSCEERIPFNVRSLLPLRVEQVA